MYTVFTLEREKGGMNDVISTSGHVVGSHPTISAADATLSPCNMISILERRAENFRLVTKNINLFSNYEAQIHNF